MGRARRAAVGLAALWVAAAACGREGPPPPVAVHHEDGVRVVENHRPARQEGAGWSVADSPSTVVAAAPGADGAVGARRLPDGRLAVLEGRARRLTLHASDGSSRSVQVPAPPEGPPGPLELAALLPGDTMAVAGDRGPLVQLIGPDGRPGRRLRLEGPGAGVFTPWLRGAFGDGTLVATPRSDRVVLPGGKVLRDTLPLLAFDHRSGALRDTLASIAGPARYHGSVELEGERVVGRIRRPYGAETLVAVGDTALLLARNRALGWEARRVDGTPRTRATAPWSPRKVEAADIAAYREEAPRRAPEGYGELRRRLLGEVSFPGRKPILDALLVDAGGHVWAGRAAGPWTPPSRWEVFAPDGRWLGTVATPPGLEVVQVGRDFVVGVRRGPDGRREAAVHRLRKPSSG